MISTIRKLWSAIYLGCASSSTAQGDTLVVKQEQPELMAQSILRLQGMERSDLKHR